MSSLKRGQVPQLTPCPCWAGETPLGRSTWVSRHVHILPPPPSPQLGTCIPGGQQVLQGPSQSGRIPRYLEALQAKPCSHFRNAIFCVCQSALTGLKQHHFQRFHGDGCLVNACDGDVHGQQSPARQRCLWPVHHWHRCPSHPQPFLPWPRTPI